MGVLAAWIQHLIGGSVRLFDSGNNLTTDGTVGVVTIDQTEKMRRDSEGQLLSCKDGPRPFFGG